MIQSRLFFSIGWLVVLIVFCSTGLLGVHSCAAEMVQLEGRFLKLTTDLQSAEEAKSLVDSFDAAVPQWLEFWGIPESSVTDWKVDVCVMRDKAEFQRQGLIPDHIPDFPFGYAWNDNVWVLAQQSEYYTRHLLLHEGVHSLAYHLYQGAGPTWFQEGTAELLATHSGVGATVKVNEIPANRDDVPYWGRFKLIQQLRSDQQVPTLDSVLRYQPDLTGDVATYGWSWAACMILDAYPEYRPAFVEAAKSGSDTGPGFNRDLANALSRQWPILAARWQLMCHELDYGFDWSRELVDLSTKDPIWDGREFTVQIQADRGWQSCGVRVPKGASIRVIADGRVTLAQDPRPWVSEPSGITYQYHRGRPVGKLLACVLPNAMDPQAKRLQPLQIETPVQQDPLEIEQYSWLLFRINDAVDALADNQGHFNVTIQRAR